MTDKSKELVDDLEGLIAEHTDDTPEQDTVDEVVEETKVEFEIPEKFKGKSMEDIVKSYQELESFNGRQAQEVGELRKAVDNYFNKELEILKAGSEQPQPKRKLKSDDLFDDPDEAISNRVNELLAERLAPIEHEFKNTKSEEKKRKFESQHPDYLEVAQSAEFREWVDAKPHRAKRFADANSKYDYDTADELLSEYEERQELLKEIKQRQKAKNDEDLRKAEGTPSHGGGTSKGKPIWSRSALIELRDRDPARWKQLWPQIYEAYQEKRVRK